MRKSEAKEVVRVVYGTGSVCCDTCKVEYSFEESSEYMHEIVIEVDPESCCSLKVRRDLCHECFNKLDPQLSDVLRFLGVPESGIETMDGTYDSDDEE